jgi:hypothetical protein
MADLTSVSPYFDDFDATKNYVKVLFKPGVAVQSRELTQSQSILQNQIKQVGDFLFTDSDKVLGPKPIVNLNVRNIRLNSLDNRGVPINVNDFLGTYVTGGTTKNLIGYVEFVYSADDPNLGDPPSIVISLKKFNSTNNGMFGASDAEDLYFYTDYTDALNEATPNFKARTTTDITKNAISTISPYSRSITFTNPTTLISVGDLVVHPLLTTPLYVTEIVNTLEVLVNNEPGVVIGGETVSFVTKACNPTSIVTQDIATFYKYGYFVQNTLSKIVPDKTTAYPTKLIAFLSNQQIITSEDDPSLLDPAFESSNYFASGADRLKIELSLASIDIQKKSITDYINTGNTTGKDIIPLLNFNRGDIEYLRELSVDSNLEKKLAERTYDQSGSYVVDQFHITPGITYSNNPNLQFKIGPGKAYVGGYPVKTVGTTNFAIPKSNKTETKVGYNINTFQGNYLKVSNVKYLLVPPQTTNASYSFLELHNVRNPANATTRVGTVSFKDLEYDTSLGQDTIFKFFYNYYAPVAEAPASWSAWSTKYNIPSDEGQYIANALYTNNDLLGNYGTASTPHYGLFREPDVAGVAFWWSYWNSNGRDIAKVKEAFAITAEKSSTSDSARVLSNTKSYLQVINNSPFIDGLLNVQQVKSIVGVANELTSQGTSATYGSPFFYADIADPAGLDSSNNIKIFDPISADKLVYDINKKYVTTLRNIRTQYNKVYNNAIFAGGTYSKTLSLPETLAVGDGTIPSSTARSNFVVLVKSGATSNVKLGAFNFERGSVVVTGSGATVSFDLGDPSFTGVADILLKIQNDNTQIRTKTLVQNAIVNIEVNAAEKEYSLGIADIYRFGGIYKLSNIAKYRGTWSSGTNYSYEDVVLNYGYMYKSIYPSSNVSVYNANVWSPIPALSSNNYVLNDGQRDNFYDHASIKYIGGTSSIPGNVLVTFSYFNHTGEGPLTAESYSANLYSAIPTYKSVTDSREYSLRDSIDFRPRRIDNSTYQNYDTAVIPISSAITEADVTYLLGRIDRLYVTNTLQNFNSPYNSFLIETGIPSLSPVEPTDNSDLTKLSIATIAVPAYSYNATECVISYSDYKRYTMVDIGNIQKLTTRLDKQIKLHAIEIANLKGVITNDNGDSLLKTGILVEDFTTIDRGDTVNSGFLCAIDTVRKVCSPGVDITDVSFFMTDPNTTNISRSADIISMPYVEEIFASNLEANHIINVNPAGIDDGRGRAVLSRQNGRGVNLLLTGLLIISGYYLITSGVGAIIAGAIGTAITSIATTAAAYLIVGYNSLIAAGAAYFPALSQLSITVNSGILAPVSDAIAASGGGSSVVISSTGANSVAGGASIEGVGVAETGASGTVGGATAVEGYEGVGVAETGASGTVGGGAATAGAEASGAWTVPEIALAVAATYVVIKYAPEIGAAVKHVGDQVQKTGQDIVNGVNDLGDSLADIGGW